MKIKISNQRAMKTPSHKSTKNVVTAKPDSSKTAATE